MSASRGRSHRVRLLAICLAVVVIVLAFATSSHNHDGARRPAHTVAYTGTGDRAFPIRKPSGNPDESVILFARSSAATAADRGSPFSVTLVSGSGRRIDTPVRGTAGYRGSVLIDPEEGSLTRSLQVVAPARWRVELRPVSTAPTFTSSMRGSGDEVLRYRGPASAAVVRHAPVDAPFIIETIVADEPEALLQVTGGFAGRITLPGRGLLMLTTRGPWSITPTGHTASPRRS